MMINAESLRIADDRPEADVLDQLTPVIDSVGPSPLLQPGC
jgi:hypothetical protein